MSNSKTVSLYAKNQNSAFFGFPIIKVVSVYSYKRNLKENRKKAITQ